MDCSLTLAGMNLAQQNVGMQDDFLEKSSSVQDSLLQQYQATIINSLITTFCLDNILFTDKDGGNVQTLHNAENHVYADETFRERGERDYNRDDYAPAEYMNQRRKKDFQTKETIVDGYTGKQLPKDGRAHLEHVVSAKEFHDNTAARVFMTSDEMSHKVNDNNNTIYTDSSLNQSKGASTLSEWADKKRKKTDTTNAEHYEVNKKMAKKVDKKARDYLNKEVTRKKITHYATSMTKDSLHQGGAMAIRQGLGVIFTEVVLTIFEEIPSIMSSASGSIKNFFSAIVDLVKQAFVRVQKKLSNIVKAMKDGFLAGGLNSIVTTIINLFMTTAKNMITILRQAMVSITDAVKILFFDKEYRSPGERVIAASKIILVGASSVLGVMLEQALHTSLSSTGLASIPVIGEVLVSSVSTFAGILLTGLLSVTFMYFIDHSAIIHDLVKFINEMFDDGFGYAMHKMEEANRLLDEYIAKLCEIDIQLLHKKIAELRSLNTAIQEGNTDVLYSYCSSAGISLQFSNTQEFTAFMCDKNTNLEF